MPFSRPMHERAIVESDVPARLDRLPWSRFHWLVVVALGITWILDGLEVTLAGAVSGALKESPALHLDNEQVGLAGSAYLVGAVLGALFFGRLTDRLGRKKLFSVTVLVYLLATAATAFSWDIWSFLLFRFVTGAGIGGEYAAINSAIQELIPARYRGRTDLAINGSFWVGAALGALGSVMLLEPGLLPADLGWRLAFFIGAALGVVILFLRRYLPESPRWLMTHGRGAEAQEAVAGIEARVAAEKGKLPPAEGRIRIRPLGPAPLARVARTLLRDYPRRTVLGLVLMGSQAFFYNAIFFSYALVLTSFYDVPSASVGWYILPFAVGNFLGPLCLGPLFDTYGRRPMIAGTYAISGILLGLTGWLFHAGLLDAGTQAFAWSVIFFFASAAASAAYLTVGESFPLEIRALAIALFYAVGTGLGGAAGPWLFGYLVQSGSSFSIFLGYLFGAALMLIAAAVELALGIAAERRPLESVAEPLSAVVVATPPFIDVDMRPRRS
jgi:MFS family permease